jgi:hypothetical protein
VKAPSLRHENKRQEREGKGKKKRRRKKTNYAENKSIMLDEIGSNKVNLNM